MIRISSQTMVALKMFNLKYSKAFKFEEILKIKISLEQ